MVPRALSPQGSNKLSPTLQKREFVQETLIFFDLLIGDGGMERCSGGTEFSG